MFDCPLSKESKERIAAAQLRSASLYRQYERRSPWNSRTRREWARLAEQAENFAAALRATS